MFCIIGVVITNPFTEQITFFIGMNRIEVSNVYVGHERMIPLGFIGDKKVAILRNPPAHEL